MNTDKIIAESIAKDYAPKESSKLVALKKLDKKAKLPATIFTYSCGIISALVFGSGMSLAMQVIGSGIGGMIIGIIVGILGIIGCCVNYPIYKKMLEKGKKKKSKAKAAEEPTDNEAYTALKAFAAEEHSQVIPICCQIEAEIAELSAEEKTALLAQQDYLENIGLSLDDFGGRSVMVREVPADIRVESVEDLVQEIAARLAAGQKEPLAEKTAWVLHSIACRAAIKGGVSAMELLNDVDCQVELSNTYHLHIRPGDKLIYDMGGLHKFMNWPKPILTDSGGFQVFSLSSLRKITEEGVKFASHIDGKRIFMGPEESMQIQSHLASTIAMAFDECIENPAPYQYVKQSCGRTVRWLERCRAEMDRLNSLPETINRNQMLFGINQGCTYDDLRIEHMKQIRELPLDGFAIGGLAVGESHEDMYHILDVTVPHLPKNKPTYLMGVGTPANILEAVDRGVDFFDCVYPSRNGRHGHVYTNFGKKFLNFF